MRTRGTHLRTVHAHTRHDLLNARAHKCTNARTTQAFAQGEELLGEGQLEQQLTQEQQVQLARLREEAAKLRSTVPERDG